MKAALLFLENLANALQEWGFEINPYDWCVANKEINGSQCTVLWPVDNLKISHKDANVVNALFAVHPNMKSHTGGMLMMGRGAIHDSSNKLKLNTQSSPKAEIVGEDDLMPQVLWTRYFIEAQGYK
eukprot:5999550-Ditylum_brightwellii.AAC.2